MLKKILSCAAALALAAATAVSVCADTETDDYGMAGIQWMIKDQWAHRNAVGLDPLNEMETDTLDVTHEDVVITGNGDYTVSMYGWVVPEADIDYVEVGTLGLSTSIDFDAYPDCAVELTECVIDGVTYIFDEQPELEEENGCHVLKIKNAYGSNAVTTPEMDAWPWRSTDPITISFTVSGLPEDKIADNPDETVVIEYASSASSEEDTDSGEEETSSDASDEETASEDTPPLSDTSANTNTSASDADESESSSSVSLAVIIIIVIAAAGVLAAVIALIVRAVKKK